MTILSCVPFKAEHAASLEDLAEGVVAFLTPDAAALVVGGNSWTVLNGDTVLACFGTLQLWPGRHMGWAGVSESAGPHMTYITRRARECARSVVGRVEFQVREDFENGNRWAKLLGFQIENPPGILKQYGPEGENHIAYVMFNRG